MNAVAKIIDWVQTKPLFLVRFDEEQTESLHNSRQGINRFTMVKSRADLKDIKPPTICLLETLEQGISKCYLATATSKTKISTLDSRITIKKLRSIYPNSLQAIAKLISDLRMKHIIDERLPREGEVKNLSSKLSACIVKILAKFPDNQSALEMAFSLVPSLRQASNTVWAQEDAVQTAMATFGIWNNDIPAQVAIKRGASSGLDLLGEYLYEDNVVHADASQIPGFELISVDMTGRAVFQKNDEQLVLYTANKLPLEKMLGVDLIYINKTRGNIVMIQYKMLEEDKRNNDNADWIYRPDQQLHNEISRMRLLKFSGALDDYRLSGNPFFFKFVKRKIGDNKPTSFIVALEHLKQILDSPDSTGPRNGIRISYNALEGAYLRKDDLIGLIRSGYIGTHKAETAALTTIIGEAAKGNHAVVLAWQQKIRETAE